MGFKMTDILPPAGWPNVRQLETNEFATGGANGNMNEQAKSLAARSELLKQYAALPYESKTDGYALNERVQLTNGDIVKSTADENTNNPNVNMAGWVNIDAAIMHYGRRFLAPMYGVKADGITDDSPALNAIIAQMQTGDILEVLPTKHKLNTPLIIDKPIKITSNSIRYQTSGALFECETDGVVFKAPYITWEAINLVGKYTSAVLDPGNGIYGSVGLNHEINAIGGGVGTIVRDSYVTYFDTNVTEVTGAGETWAGCYREYYNVFLRYGRINLAMMDGATLSNWHGGAIQLAKERGVYLDCPTNQYNNVIFHGTALEKNGYIALPFPADSKKHYGLYAGRNSKITLMGAYNEDQSMFAENGGIIEILGGYQHSNSRAFAKKFGVIAMYGGFGALTSKLSINENYATFLSTTSANSLVTQTSAFNKSCRVTSTSSGTGVSVYSRAIALTEYHAKDIKAVKLAFKYNISSGYTANPNIVVNPVIRITAVGGSDVSISNMTYPQIELIGETGKDCTFELVWKPRNGGSFLPLDAVVSAIQIFFNIQNLDGSFCNFSSDNLNLLIKSIDVEVFGNQSVNLISELPKYGTTAARPVNLGLFERGFIYYDTTLGQSIVWNGLSWIEVYKQTISSTTTAMSSASNAINTTDKTAGKLVHNTVAGLLYFAIGSTATAAWRATNGSGDITPI